MPNQLKVLLISDRQANRAAASLDVQVGSRHDPVQSQGLAHFLEHMLFLGTEKYPVADEYQQFISQHGGSRNAYTSFEHTNYYFDIDNTQLVAALDRFADFFIAPNFDAAYIEREINAVDSEYRAGLSDEYRRIIDVIKQQVNPQHPFAKFSVGNLQTLARPGIRDELIQFYHQYYSASRMSLAVTGDYSLDDLEAMVRHRFSQIKNNGSSIQLLDMPLFEAREQGLVLAVKTRKVLRQLHLAFPLPDLAAEYRSKPAHTIGHIIGHEGEGSLLSALKEKGLVESISASKGVSYTGGSLFQVSMVLTDKGLGAVEQVVEAFFVLREKMLDEFGAAPAVSKERFEEQKKLASLAFRFVEQGTPLSTAISAASRLPYYSPSEVLYGDYDFSDYDPDLVVQLLEMMHPANMLLVLASDQLPDDFVPDQHTQWYEAQYQAVPVPTEWSQLWQSSDLAANSGWNSAIQLPTPNPFIAEDFSLYSASDVDSERTVPVLLVSEPGMEFWLKTDDSFEVPKLDIRVALVSDYVAQSPRHQALANLYSFVVGEQLNEFIYPAYLAGLNASFYPTLRGFAFNFGGYNDGLGLLLATIVNELRELQLEPQRFDVLRKELERQWLLAQEAAPARRLGSLMNSELYPRSADYPQLIEALRQLSYADLAAFVEEFWPSVYIEGLLHGNIDKAGAQELAAVFNRVPRCECQRAEVQKIDIRQLDAGVFQKQVSLKHDDAALRWYFQAPDDSDQSVVVAMLTADIMHPLMFNALRTEQQLGYIVSASYHSLYRRPGLVLTLQSPQSVESDIRQAVQAYLNDFLHLSVPEEVFARHRRALVGQLREKDSNLRARTARYWRSMTLGETRFDRNERLARALEVLDYAQWQRLVEVLLGTDSSASLLLSTSTER